MPEVGATKYATSGDLSVAYQVIGDGPLDLIYVPGIVSHVEFFHQLPGYSEFLDGLASFARLVVFQKALATGCRTGSRNLRRWRSGWTTSAS